MVKLYCIGCGPGDPELITVKAKRILETAEVIFTPTSKSGKPSIALSIASTYINNAKIIDLIFPMIKDKNELQHYWKKNADIIAKYVTEGKRCVYITVGDPSLYSTWIYIHRELQTTYKMTDIEIIPGIPSMFAFAAEAKLSLAEGEDTLSIVPACYDLKKVSNTVNSSDTVIFLKDGRYFDKVIDMLSTSGFSDNSEIAIAQDVSSEGEIIKISKLKDLIGKNGPAEKYFSLMVAKKKNE